MEQLARRLHHKLKLELKPLNIGNHLVYLVVDGSALDMLWRSE